MNAVLPNLGLEYVRNALTLDGSGQKKIASLREVSGYAATWEPDQVGDRIVRGAFADSIRDKHYLPLQEQGRSGIRVLYQHDEPIGVLKDIKEDEYGLWIRAYISRTRQGEDTLILLEDGGIDRMSIGFNVLESEPLEENGQTLRLIRRMDLWEVSFVTFPANLRARVMAVKGREVPDTVKWVSIPVQLKLETKSLSEEAERELAGNEEASMSNTVTGETKAGRVLSSANANKLRALSKRARETADEIDGILQAAGYGEDDKGEEKAEKPAGCLEGEGEDHDKSVQTPPPQTQEQEKADGCATCAATGKSTSPTTVQDPASGGVESETAILEALKAMRLGFDRVGKEGAV